MASHEPFGHLQPKYTIAAIAPPRCGGTNLITILLKGVIDNKLIGISTLEYTIIGFMAPKLVGITLKPLYWFPFKTSRSYIQPLL
jgi:hypothetical protein